MDTQGVVNTERGQRLEFPDLSRLLSPRSIAVVGASDEPGNLGGVAVRYLRRFGYPGAVWPVNPRRASVGGFPCYPSVADVPGTPDLAILAVQAKLTPDLVRSCAAAGVRHGIVWAGGFAEVGGGGVELQDALARACRDTGFSLVGPNCIGLIDTHLPVIASFASFLAETEDLVPGNISMISQSGGLGTQAQAFAQQAGFGFRYMISSGNEVSLTAADFIDALVNDEKTKIIAMYLEGVRDGDRLVEALLKARHAGKPVVALKGGSAPASARAATAHTGALVGEDRVWRAVFHELGVIQVESLAELLDVALFLGTTDLTKLPTGNGVAVITFGGGGGVLSADQSVKAGLATPPLAPTTREKLRPLVPPIASVENPVDLTPQTYNKAEYLERFPETLYTIASDPGIDMLLAQFGPMGQGAPEVIRAVAELRSRTDKTVCLAWPFAPHGAYERLREEDFHVFTEPAYAINVLAKVARHRSRPHDHGRTAVAFPGFAWSSFLPHPAAGDVLSEHECHRLLAAAGLPIAAGELAMTEDGLDNAIKAVGLPVAMKAISSDVLHRDAAGLLALDIGSEERAHELYQELTARAARLGLALDGIYVQHMVKGGREVLVSAFRDPVFGVMVSCGAGGTLTELIDDVTLARAPFDETAAMKVLRKLGLVRYAERSGKTEGFEHLAAFVASFSQLVVTAPWQRFVLEVNPVIWTPSGAVAVDGLLIVEEP